ncbi:MAG: sulfite exporter TauE/SafE family protein [Pirellulales bacterium]|nr:sulfite exporter TauE/SafE family protein [Pirellulales bacterium]
MTALFWATFVASLLGSPHCAGMCGPLALVAAAHGSRHDRRPMLAWALYHGARLIGYATLGATAAAFGAAVDLGADWLGLQRIAAVLAGAMMIVLGTIALARLWGRGMLHFSAPRWLQTRLQAAHRRLGTWPPQARAAAIGALTVFLPCGWLYAFVITAAGTATPWLGAAVMFVFWLGTVPLLSALAFGARPLAARLGRAAPLLTAVLLIAVGVQTVAVRAWANYQGLSAPAVATTLDGAVRHIEQLPERSMPCCHE